MTPDRRHRLWALDRCLVLCEEALMRGQSRVNANLAAKLITSLGAGSLVPGHRLEGRRVERVLDDIFTLQEQVLGTCEADAADIASVEGLVGSGFPVR